MITLTAKPDEVKRLRVGAALSQRELAIAAGLRRETILNVEAGRPARLSSIRKIAQALGVAPDAIANVSEAA